MTAPIRCLDCPATCPACGCRVTGRELTKTGCVLCEDEVEGSPAGE